MIKWLSLFLLFSFPLHASQIFTRTQILMGNVEVSLTLKTENKNKVKAYQAMEKAFKEAKRLETEVSEFIPSSQTSQLNRYAGKRKISIGPDLLAILNQSKEISILTNGAFDITFASTNLKANYRDIEIDSDNSKSILTKAGMKIRVSGIAKGYIVDQISQVLLKEGFNNHLVNAGDMYAMGKWKVKIREPHSEASQTLCEITLKNQAISTSGIYERGSHIINPHTHKPATGPLSTTIIASTSTMADALGTAAFILNPEEMRKIVFKNPNVSALYVDNKKTVSLGKARFSCRY